LRSRVAQSAELFTQLHLRDPSLPPTCLFASNEKMKNEKIEKRKTEKFDFRKLQKSKNKRLETFDFANFALQFARRALRSMFASDAAAV
jgi:hypothetical protein